MDAWNTSFLLGWPIFRCYVSFREGIGADSSVRSFNLSFLGSVTVLILEKGDFFRIVFGEAFFCTNKNPTG